MCYDINTIVIKSEEKQPMYSYSKFEHHYTKSFFKYVEPISEDYRVFVNGEEIPVYTCRNSAYPFNRVWTGFQRQIDQTELASYVIS